MQEDFRTAIPLVVIVVQWSVTISAESKGKEAFMSVSMDGTSSLWVRRRSKSNIHVCFIENGINGKQWAAVKEQPFSTSSSPSLN